MKRVLAFLLVAITACSNHDDADARPDASPAPGRGDVDTGTPVDAGVDMRMTCAADGGFPTPTTGHCRAALRTDAAVAPMGADGTGGFVVPDGRRVSLSAGMRVELTSG